MRKRTLLLLTAAVALAASTAYALATGGLTAQAQTNGGFDFTRPQTVASGLVAPCGLASLPDGSALVIERDSARLLQLCAGQAPAVIGTIPSVVPEGSRIPGSSGMDAKRKSSSVGWSGIGGIVCDETSVTSKLITGVRLSSAALYICRSVPS